MGGWGYQRCEAEPTQAEGFREGNTLLQTVRKAVPSHSNCSGCPRWLGVSERALPRLQGEGVSRSRRLRETLGENLVGGPAV